MPNKGFDIGAVGTSAAQGLVGSVLGLALEHHNDQRQLNQQTKLQNLQIQGQKEMADYNQQLQYDMWQKTNYPAQMEQLQKAGLNPALLYGTSGGGATTTGSGYSENVQGADAPKGGQEVLAEQQFALQLKMQEAQIRNLDADSKLKETDAAKHAGVDTKLGQAQIANLIQETSNKKSQQAGIELDNQLKDLQVQFNSATQSDREDLITAGLAKTWKELDILSNDETIQRATMYKVIDKINLEYTALQIQNELAKQQTATSKAQEGQATSQTTINQQQIQNMANDIITKQAQVLQGWTSLGQQQQEIEIKKAYQTFETDPTWKQLGLQGLRGIFNTAGSIASYKGGANMLPTPTRNPIGFK